MSGKLKAGLIGAAVGALIVVLIELLAVVFSDDVFFGSERSWLILGLAVVLFAWSQVRAHDRRAQTQRDPEDLSP